MCKVARDAAKIYGEPVESMEGLNALIREINTDKSRIPIFLNSDGKITIITSISAVKGVKKGDILIYLGKKIERQANVSKPS